MTPEEERGIAERVAFESFCRRCDPEVTEQQAQYMWGKWIVAKECSIYDVWHTLQAANHFDILNKLARYEKALRIIASDCLPKNYYAFAELAQDVLNGGEGNG